MRFAGVWEDNSDNNQLSSVENFYGNNLKDFMGYHFTVATNPWSHHVQAASLPENIGSICFRIRVFASTLSIVSIISLDSISVVYPYVIF